MVRLESLQKLLQESNQFSVRLTNDDILRDRYGTINMLLTQQQRDSLKTEYWLNLSKMLTILQEMWRDESTSNLGSNSTWTTPSAAPSISRGGEVNSTTKAKYGTSETCSSDTYRNSEGSQYTQT